MKYKINDFINRDETKYVFDLISLIESDQCLRLFEFLNVSYKLGKQYNIGVHPELGYKSFETDSKCAIDIAIVAESLESDFSIVVGIEVKMFSTPNFYDLQNQLNREALMFCDFVEKYRIQDSLIIGISVPFGPDKDSRFMTWSTFLKIYSDFKGTPHYDSIEKAVVAYPELRSQRNKYSNAEFTLKQILEFNPLQLLWIGWSGKPAEIAERALAGGKFEVNYRDEKAPSQNYHTRAEFIELVDCQKKLHEQK